MKQQLTLFLLITIIGCGQTKVNTDKTVEPTMELFNAFDKDNHLQPHFDKTKFDTLHGWKFGWAVLQPINIAKDDEDEKLLSRRLTPGQKALYFIWYLDAQVTNGGFIQFYWNDYRKYLPPIIDGLKLIGDTSMIVLVEKVDKAYLANEDRFLLQKQKNDIEPLYDSLKHFDDYDKIYYQSHNNTMLLIEKYARKNSTEFVIFK
ncbi:DUF4375 domain-containing protein [Parasediminibacterium sp. JCM 36343]|uniref:DMP19 family protein n=1 Tax=Parasediminibacterium sp. JCM 36343 TaxID=3374279 RepID=UPI00397CBB76